MRDEEAINLLLNEAECVKKQGECDRHCGVCELNRSVPDRLEALRIGREAIVIVEKMREIYQRWIDG